MKHYIELFSASDNYSIGLNNNLKEMFVRGDVDISGNIAMSGNINCNEINSTSITATTFYGDGSQLTGINTSGGSANLNEYSDASFGNVDVSGNININGNVEAERFIGDGSQLTGITDTTYSAGTGMSLAGTTFAIGQSVSTTDNPSFTQLTIGASGVNQGILNFDDFTNVGTDTIAQIKGIKEDTNGGQLQFFTKVDGGSLTERLRIDNDGAIGIGGANYGSSGQVLTSNGAGSAPIWATPSGGTKPLFQVFGQNTLQATGASGIYKLTYWNTPTIDQEAGSYGWDSVNSQYRCPIAGNYRVTALVSWQSYNITNRGIGMYIYKNNSQYNSVFTATTFHDVTGQPEYQFATLNLIIPCSQGDTIHIRSDTATNLYVFYRCSNFNVEFIQ